MRCSSIGCGSFDGFGLAQEQRLGFGLLVSGAAVRSVCRCLVCRLGLATSDRSLARVGVALPGLVWATRARVPRWAVASLHQGTTRKRLSGGGPTSRAGSLFAVSFSLSHAETSFLCLTFH